MRYERTASRPAAELLGFVLARLLGFILKSVDFAVIEADLGISEGFVTIHGSVLLQAGVFSAWP